VNPAWAVAASDAALAIVAIWVCARFLRAPLAAHQRGLAAAGCLLIASAAVVGCVRFAGVDSLLALHKTLSNQGAIVGLPLILVALAWSWLDGRAPNAALTGTAIVLLTGVTVLQMRPVSAVAAVLLVLVTMVTARRHRVVPALMLACMIGLGGLAATQQLVEHVRLILLHIVLALLLALASAATPRARPQAG